MVETLLAGVNLEEMLYEIKEHCCGMNAGRWDYIFSAIKRLSRRPDSVLPDRNMVGLRAGVSRGLDLEIMLSLDLGCILFIRSSWPVQSFHKWNSSAPANFESCLLPNWSNW